MGMGVFAQDQEEFKDVVLDGKLAVLNVATGEITLVKIEDEIVEVKIDSIKTQAILITDSSVITTSNEKESETHAVSDFHIVKEGEHLYKIAVQYKSSLAQLQKANHLETTLIKPGQKLRVRNFDQINNNEKLSVWTVKKGDTLYRIALENGITVEAIKKRNGLTDNVIKIGQKLQLK